MSVHIYVVNRNLCCRYKSKKRLLHKCNFNIHPRINTYVKMNSIILLLEDNDEQQCFNY